MSKDILSSPWETTTPRRTRKSPHQEADPVNSKVKSDNAIQTKKKQQKQHQKKIGKVVKAEVNNTSTSRSHASKSPIFGKSPILGNNGAGKTEHVLFVGARNSPPGAIPKSGM